MLALEDVMGLLKKKSPVKPTKLPKLVKKEELLTGEAEASEAFKKMVAHIASPSVDEVETDAEVEKVEPHEQKIAEPKVEPKAAPKPPAAPLARTSPHKPLPNSLAVGNGQWPFKSPQ